MHCTINIYFFFFHRKMRPRRVCPEKEALKFIASGTDKDIFQKKCMSQEKGKFSFKIQPQHCKTANPS